MKRCFLALSIGILLGAGSSIAAIMAFLAFLHVPVSIAATTADPVLLFETDRVKAWSLTIEPGQSTPQHTHAVDEIVICLESSKLRITKFGPEPNEESVQPKMGDVFMPKVKGVTHILANIGPSRYRHISIELKES